MTTDRAALARLYAGDHGRSRTRIEREQPATYWEENAVAARRLARRTILRWLDPLERHRIVDLGCGTGTLARQLAAGGAQVIGLDLLPRFDLARPAPPRLRFVVGDVRQPASPPGAFTAAVLHEVLEDYAAAERVPLVAALAGWRAQRLIIVSRVQSSWGDWADRLAAPASGGHPPVDTIALFRGIHLETPYFLTRRETVRRRNQVLEIAEFTLAHHGGEV